MFEKQRNIIKSVIKIIFKLQVIHNKESIVDLHQVKELDETISEKLSVAKTLVGLDSGKPLSSRL